MTLIPRLIVIILTAALMASCGNKGGLYLPDPNTTPEKTTSPVAMPTDEKTK